MSRLHVPSRRALRRLVNPRDVRRWLTLRCAHCGHRFRWSKDARNSFGGSNAVYHSPCMSYIVWRRRATEAEEVLTLIADAFGITERDVSGVAELRATSDDQRVMDTNKVWRVFYNTRQEVTP